MFGAMSVAVAVVLFASKTFARPNGENGRTAEQEKIFAKASLLRLAWPDRRVFLGHDSIDTFEPAVEGFEKLSYYDQCLTRRPSGLLSDATCAYMPEGSQNLKTFKEAEADCQQRGGHLAAIHTRGDVEAVQKADFPKSIAAWVGGEQAAEFETSDEGAEGAIKGWTYTDGSGPITAAAPWAPGQPNDKGGLGGHNQSCLMLSSVGLHDDACQRGETMAYLCAVRKE